MRSPAYARIESAKFGTKGVLQTSFLLVLGYLFLVFVGSFGPQVFNSATAETSAIADGGNNTYTLSSQKSNMKTFNQIIWAQLYLIRPESIALSGQFGTLSTVIDLSGTAKLLEDSSVSSDMPIIDQKLVQRDLIFVNNSRVSQPINLFIVSGVYYRNYNLSVGVLDVQTLLANYTVGVDNDESSSALMAVVDMRYMNDKYTIYELCWKYLFLVSTLFVMFFPRYGYFVRLSSIPRDLRSFEQKWISHLLSALLLFNDPLFAFQVTSEYYVVFFILYVFFLGYFIATLLLFWLAVLDNIRRRAKNDDYGVDGKTTRPYNLFFFYLPKVVIAIPTATLCVLTLSYVGFRISEDMTCEPQKSPGVGELLVASYVFVGLYIAYNFYLALCTLCALTAGAKIPYQLLGVLTCLVFIVLFSLLYVGFVDFQEESSLVFMSFHGIMNLYVWTLAMAFSPLEYISDENPDIHHQKDSLLSTDPENSQHAFFSSPFNTSRSSSLRFELPVAYSNGHR